MASHCVCLGASISAWAHSTRCTSAGHIGGTTGPKKSKLGDRSHSPINEAVIYFAYENWRRVMSVAHPSLKSPIRVRRPRKVAEKPVGKMEGSVNTSGASLVYAGYPYDPYA